MAVDIKVPSVGESITEGSIARWLKKDGDYVRRTSRSSSWRPRRPRRKCPPRRAASCASSVKEGDRVAIGSVVGRDRCHRQAAPADAARQTAARNAGRLAAAPAQPASRRVRPSSARTTSRGFPGRAPRRCRSRASIPARSPAAASMASSSRRTCKPPSKRQATQPRDRGRPETSPPPPRKQAAKPGSA